MNTWRSRRARISGFLILMAVLVVVVGWQVGGEEITEIFVRNFPEKQEVFGEVEVEKPIPHSKFLAFEDKVVSPAGRADYDRLDSLGTIDTSGFAGAVLSVTGEIRGTVVSEGQVGLLLVPDVTPISRTFRETGDAQLALEVIASYSPASGGRFAAQVDHLVGFDRYRVYVFNEGSQSVEAHVYAYLYH